MSRLADEIEPALPPLHPQEGLGEDELAPLLYETNMGDHAEPGTTTVGDYLGQWLWTGCSARR